LEACDLSYIPERLHTNDRPEIPIFEIGEYLYHRCKPEHLNQPFDGITLYDLSTNREGRKDSPLCQKEDVLFNTEPHNGHGEKYDWSVVTFEISEVSESKTYEKIISSDGKDGKGKPIVNICEIKLLHDRLPCNYSHSIMRLRFNGEVVTRDNYNTTIGRRGDSVTQLRNKCKIELESMIQNE
jgi:hypothetical protein